MPARFRSLDDGWFSWSDGSLPAANIRVRFATREDGRLHVAGLQVEGKVSAELLRSVPIGRIEAAANAQLAGYATTARRKPVSPKLPDALRSNSIGGYPDAFYDTVAEVYRGLVTMSSRPVYELATANDVPVTTAQRWVKEARRRGLLAPGHPGKAG